MPRPFPAEPHRRDEPPPLPGEAVRGHESARAEVDLTCNECGAPLRWSPADSALRCDHCGALEPVEVESGTIPEYPLEAAASAARGLGVDVRVLVCETCAARVTFDGDVTSKPCPFCGSPSVLDQEANRSHIRPESLIPLEIEEKRVEEAFRRWIKSLWFRPGALKHTKHLHAVGVYVPAWTFDASVRSSWNAESGTYYWVTESYTAMENGRPVRRTRQVRKVRWWPSSGRRKDAYDDVLVVASKGIDDELARKLGPFSTEGLVPYSPAFLAGWRAEEYQIDLDAGWKLGRERIEAEQIRRCAGDVPGDTHRSLRVRNEVSDVLWKHVLLPMWSVTYEYQGKPYAVLVHGESGRVVGHAPYSWVKILLFALGVIVLAGILLLVAGHLQ
ncbi:MAG: hypothetical protein AAF726_18605 [Planctomycetota bacterium]